MARRRRLALALVALATSVPGCVPGRIYTHIHGPLSTNFNRTPVFSGDQKGRESDVKHLSIPLFKIDVSVDLMWNSNAIGDIARNQGIEEVYYADLERLSILGIWNQYTVHVYGKPAEKASSAEPAGTSETTEPAN